MARMSQWIGLAAVGLTLTGCVSQEKYAAMKLDRDRYAARAAQHEAELREARGSLDLLRQQMGGIGGAITSKDALLANLQAQNADLQRQYDDAMRRLQEALGRTGGNALSEPLTTELQAFAAQNPDLVEFDAQKGMVKFKSDVTFASGDASLTPQAKQAIARFSQILNSSAAAGHELMIAGHTDNQPVANPATKAKGHHNNWYLSAHRAISVADELMGQRVSPARVAVVGYAEQRPIAANTDAAGRAANRRVEVLILPTTVRGAAVETAPSGAAPAAPAQVNKDAATPADNRPALNK